MLNPKALMRLLTLGLIIAVLGGAPAIAGTIPAIDQAELAYDFADDLKGSDGGVKTVVACLVVRLTEAGAAFTARPFKQAKAFHRFSLPQSTGPPGA